MIIAGFGFRAEATQDSLLDAFRMTGCDSIDAIATADDKAEAASLQALAQFFGKRVLPVDQSALQAAQTTTQSDASLSHRAIGSVAEAAALAAAGEGAKLLTTRFISQDRMATCAIAQGPNI